MGDHGQERVRAVVRHENRRRRLIRAGLAVLSVAAALLVARYFTAPATWVPTPFTVSGVSQDGRQLEVEIECVDGRVASVEYHDAEVVVEIEWPSSRSFDACASQIFVELDEPLGLRTVVDATSGRRFPPPMYIHDETE